MYMTLDVDHLSKEIWQHKVATFKQIGEHAHMLGKNLLNGWVRP